MVAMLLAYDANGRVIATLDCLTRRDARGEVIGLVDFAAHEAAGGEMTELWQVDGAKGSKVWPEWLGCAAHDFTVELDGPPGAKRIAALVHAQSGARRERDSIEMAIAERVAEARANDAPADLRDLVGGPGRPLRIDDKGDAVDETAIAIPALPIVGLGQQER
jgi:hypothetical protein